MGELFQLTDELLAEALAQFQSGEVMADDIMFKVIHAALQECTESRVELRYARSTGDECALLVRGWRNDSNRLSWVEQHLCRTGKIEPMGMAAVPGMMKCWMVVTARDDNIRDTIDLLIAGGASEQPQPHAQKH